MIVDPSAVVALLLREPTADAVRVALRRGSRSGLAMSAGSTLELTTVIDRRADPVLSHQLDDLVGRLSIEIVPFDVDQAKVGRQAYRDFGRGSGHPARLDLGDCFSYALASVRREPLLFVGDDFTHTDLRSVL